MAFPPGGPQGDYVSQTEYAARLIKERQNAPPQPAQTQAAARQEERPMPSPEEAKLALTEKIAAENERNEAKNNASRAQHLGNGPRGELTDKARAAYEAKAQQMAPEQKQGQGQDRAQEQKRQQEMDNSR